MKRPLGEALVLEADCHVDPKGDENGDGKGDGPEAVVEEDHDNHDKLQRTIEQRQGSGFWSLA